jgi:RNA polymerase sigma-70 factor (ECF subfamily)
VRTLEQFSLMFNRYRHALARTAARIVKPHDVEDVVQETYLRIYQAAQRQPIRFPRAFMLTTARNIALNLATRADALNHTDELAPELALELRDAVAPSAEERAEADEEFLAFCRAVRGLPPQCRKAFVLKRVYGLSQREVAAELAISEGAVEKLLARGLAACASYMAASDYPQQARRAVRRRA